MKKSTSASLLYPLSPSSLRTSTAGEPAAAAAGAGAGAAEPGPGPGPTAAAGGCLVSANCNFIGSKFLPETMRRRASATLLVLFLSLFLFSSFSLYSVRNPINAARAIFSSRLPDSPDHHHHHPPVTLDSSFPSNHIVHEPEPEPDLPLHNLTRQYVSPATRQDSPSPSPSLSPPLLPPAADDGPHSIDSVAILFPDWEVLVIVSPETSATSLVSTDDVICLYPNGATSPAVFYRILPSTNQSAFKCYLPPGNRRRLPFLSPVLVRSLQKDQSPPPPQKMMRWNFMVYDSFSTEDDVVLFVKGVNNRQGINRSPEEFRCVFTDDKNNTVRTAVTSSIQEVFRCPHPDLTALNPGGKQGGGGDPIKVIKISLEIWDGNQEEEEKQVLVLVPSLAHYTPCHKIANAKPKLELCACTMVYNVAKFLREWVVYHSSIGVQKFILYDNDSDDDLKSTVDGLNREGYKVETVMWVWPKTQEAGFSHAALFAKRSCTWMMYVDVDEFVFSPSWGQHSWGPSDHMLKSFLPNSSSSSSDHHHHRMIGQVSIKCNEFGPSNQKTHPVEGVTQGYDCRRKQDNRHKSIVLLDAVDHSLLNVIHHFHVKDKYRWKQISLDEAVVNHYKYQAWSEFKAKFRRRVSAYVVDWRNSLNPKSKDRTPGLGFQAIKPPGWENKFCEVRDDRLKLLTQRWFGKQTQTGYKMAWQT